MKSLKWLTLGIIGIFTLFSIIADQQFVFANEHQSGNSTKLSKEHSTEKDLIPELSHEEITGLTDRFMDTLVQETNENYKVIPFDTKAELLNEFEKITTKEMAQPFVDYYYTEKPGGLYILPTETPPWFIEENDYDMIKVNDSTVKVIQDNYTELDGNYTLELEFTYKTDWKITNIRYE